MRSSGQTGHETVRSDRHEVSDHRHAPRDCPVCGRRLALTRLSCEGCGTEMSGRFHACDFCALSAEDRSILRVFLASRGNLKEVERHLEVSYPTARARFDVVLVRLGLGPAGPPPPPGPPVSMDTLEALAAGEINVDEAIRRL